MFAACVLPIFAFRHYVQDGGRFPAGALADHGLREGEVGQRRAGMMPYIVLIAGAIVVLVANWYFQLPG